MSVAQDVPIRRRRQDLEVSRREEAGRVLIIVHDPVRKLYFQLGEDAFHVLELLDGRRGAEEVVQEFLVRHDAELPPAVLSGFVQRLEGMGLLEIPPEEASSPFRRAAPPRGLFSRILFLRVRTIDPGRLLERLHSLFSFAFSPFAVAAVLFSIFAASAVVADRWDELIGGASRLMTPSSIALLWVTFLGIIVLHESAHGVACVHFGGRVPGMGFLLIYLLPACYTDVSAAWMFPRRARLWVSMAGLFAEGFLWSICVFLWRVATPESAVYQVCRGVIFVCGTGAVFNLNPLIKLDGYYALSDLLSIPNLRSRSMSYLGRLAWWLTTGFRVEGPTTAPRERRVFLLYGPLALGYTALLLGAILAGFGRLLVEVLGGVGGALFAWFALSTLAPLALSFVTGVRSMAAQSEKKRAVRRPLILLLLAALAAAVAWAVPMELRVTGPFVLEPQARRHVCVPFAGLVAEVLVSEGDRVRAGQVVASMERAPLELERERAVAALDKARADLKALEAGARPEEIARVESKLAVARLKADSAAKTLARNDDLHKKGMIALDALEASEQARDVATRELAQAESELGLVKAGARAEEVQGAKARVRELEQAVAQADYRLAGSSLCTPIAGTVLTRDPGAVAGKYVDAGAEVCEIGGLESLVAAIEVPEKELADVRNGARVTLKAASLPSEEFEGSAQEPSPVLEERNGVRVARIRCTLGDARGRLRPGMTGEARIDCGERRSLAVFGRKLVRLLRIEFW